MISTVSPFLLTYEQATRLQTYIQTYRHYGLTTLSPSAERNTLLRSLQTLQGKVVETLDQKATPLRLLMTREEMNILKLIVTELSSLYAKQPESNERAAILYDLTALETSLKR